MMTAKKKRAPYVSSACYACKAGKRKCSGDRPCARCARLGKPCSTEAMIGYAGEEKSASTGRQENMPSRKRQRQDRVPTGGHRSMDAHRGTRLFGVPDTSEPTRSYSGDSTTDGDTLTGQAKPKARKLEIYSISSMHDAEHARAMNPARAASMTLSASRLSGRNAGIAAPVAASKNMTTCDHGSRTDPEHTQYHTSVPYSSRSSSQAANVGRSQAGGVDWTVTPAPRTMGYGQEGQVDAELHGTQASSQGGTHDLAHRQHSVSATVSIHPTPFCNARPPPSSSSSWEHASTNRPNNQGSLCSAGIYPDGDQVMHAGHLLHLRGGKAHYQPGRRHIPLPGNGSSLGQEGPTHRTAVQIHHDAALRFGESRGSRNISHGDRVADRVSDIRLTDSNQATTQGQDPVAGRVNESFIPSASRKKTDAANQTDGAEDSYQRQSPLHGSSGLYYSTTGRIRRQAQGFWHGLELQSTVRADHESPLSGEIQSLPVQCKRLAAAVGKVLDSELLAGVGGRSSRLAACADVLLADDAWLGGLQLGRSDASSEVGSVDGRGDTPNSTTHDARTSRRPGSAVSGTSFASSSGGGSWKTNSTPSHRQVHTHHDTAPSLAPHRSRASSSLSLHGGHEPAETVQEMQGLGLDTSMPVAQSRRAAMLQNVAIKHLPVPAARMEFAFEPNRPVSLYINDAASRVLGFGCEQLSGCIQQGYLPIAYDPSSWLARGRAVLPVIAERRAWLVHRSKMRRLIQGDVRRPWEGLRLQSFEMTETVYFEWFDEETTSGEDTSTSMGSEGGDVSAVDNASHAAGESKTGAPAPQTEGHPRPRFRSAISYFSDIVDLSQSIWIQPSERGEGSRRSGASHGDDESSNSSPPSKSSPLHPDAPCRTYQFPEGSALASYFVSLARSQGLGGPAAASSSTRSAGVSRTSEVLRGGRRRAFGVGCTTADGPAEQTSVHLTPAGNLVADASDPLLRMASPYQFATAVQDQEAPDPTTEQGILAPWSLVGFTPLPKITILLQQFSCDAGQRLINLHSRASTAYLPETMISEPNATVALTLQQHQEVIQQAIKHQPAQPHPSFRVVRSSEQNS